MDYKSERYNSHYVKRILKVTGNVVQLFVAYMMTGK